MKVCNTLLCLVLSLLRSNANQNIIGKNNKDENYSEISFLDGESLMECVIDLAQITGIPTPTILILENRKDNYDDTFFSKIIQTFAKRDLAIAIQDKHNHAVNQTLDIYDGYVIVVVYFENFDELLNFNMGNVDKRVKYLVITSELAEDYIIKLQRFGQHFIERDVTFIIHNLTDEKHDVITFLPAINGETCQHMAKIEPKYINVCRNGSLETDVVFPVQSKVDFKNCSLRVGMTPFFPHSQIPDSDKLKSYDTLHDIEGSDVEIIKIIANYFNASIVWLFMHREMENPLTTKKYVEFVRNGSVDASAGALYRIEGNLVSYSGTYNRQASFWVYVAHRSNRSWVNLVHKLHGIYLFYLIYLCYSVLSYAFCKYDRNRLPFKDILLFSWGSLIGGSFLPEPKSSKHKILNIFYLLLCIYFSVYMNIQLVSFLTVDGPSTTFKTNDDVISSGRTAYLNARAKLFIQDSKHRAYVNTSKNCGEFIDCAYKILDFDGLTGSLDALFYPLQASTAVKGEARILRTTENIVVLYHEMLIRKDSSIVAGFQKVLTRLFEAGICDHLYKKAIGLTVMAKADSANKNAVSNSYSCESGCAITLSQFAHVFYVWAIGCSLSLTVLLFEIFWKSKKSWFIKA